MPKKMLIFYKGELTRMKFHRKKQQNLAFYHRESNFVENIFILETVRLSSVKNKFDDKETQFS